MLKPSYFLSNKTPPSFFQNQLIKENSQNNCLSFSAPDNSNKYCKSNFKLLHYINAKTKNVSVYGQNILSFKNGAFSEHL